MRRAIVACTRTEVLAALAIAAPAGADIPPVHGGSVIGRNLPLKVFGSISPPVHLFGDAITAKVSVVADRKFVAPGNVRVLVNFAPYKAVARPTGTKQQRSLAADDVDVDAALPDRAVPSPEPVEPVLPRLPFPSRARGVPLARRRGPVRARRTLPARRGPLPAESFGDHALGAHTLLWQDRITPVSRPNYRVSPTLVFWLSVALAIVLGAAGLALAARWALQFRPSRAAAID